MSERWARSCRGKRHYRSERRAIAAAKESQRKFGVPMNAYECDFHPGEWVVGNTYPQNGRQARLEREAEEEEIPSW